MIVSKGNSKHRDVDELEMSNKNSGLDAKEERESGMGIDVDGQAGLEKKNVDTLSTTGSERV